jgi:hypothetical protein
MILEQCFAETLQQHAILLRECLAYPLREGEGGGEVRMESLGEFVEQMPPDSQGGEGRRLADPRQEAKQREEGELQRWEEERGNLLIDAPEVFESKQEDVRIRRRVVEDVEEEITPFTCKEEPLEILLEHREGFQALCRTEVPSAMVLLDGDAEMPERLEDPPEATPESPHSLCGDRQPPKGIREEHTETVSLACIVHLEHERLTEV